MFTITKFIRRNYVFNGKLKVWLRSYSSAGFQISQSNKELFEVRRALPSYKSEVSAENDADIKRLLKRATENKNSAFKALEILANWSRTKKINFTTDVETDPNFSKFTAAIEKCSDSLSVFHIMEAIENLLSMGISNNNILVESLENDLLWHVQKVRFSTLLAIINFQQKHQETERQKQILIQATQAIERCWCDIEANDVISVYKFCKHIDKSILIQIEFKIVNLISDTSVDNLHRIWVEISKSGRRPTPVLRSLSHHTFKSSQVLTIDQIIDIMYAVIKMNFFDQALLEKLSANFIEQIENISKPSTIFAMLRVMGLMRWRDVALLDAITDWILVNEADCSLVQFASYIRTLANLSYAPDNSSDFMDRIASKLSHSIVNNDQQWIDIVWSLCLLGKVTHEQLDSILTSDFVENLNYSDPVLVGTLLKIMNINATSKLMSPSCTKKILSDINLDDVQITTSKSLLNLKRNIVLILSNLLPPPKYMRENIRSQMGFSVDIELIVDKNGKPLPVDDFSTNFGTIKSLKPLPIGGQRLALMVWDYKDYTIGSQELTGANQFIVNMLRHHKYNVVQVPHYEISTKDSLVKSVQYFEKIICKAI